MDERQASAMAAGRFCTSSNSAARRSRREAPDAVLPSRRSTGDPRSCPSSAAAGRLVAAPVLLTQEEHALRPGVGENRATISDERYSCVDAAGLSLCVSRSVRRRRAGGVRARRLVPASARASRCRCGRAGRPRRSSSPSATAAASAAQPPSSGRRRGTTSARGRLRAPGRRARGVARLLAGGLRAA